MSVETLVALGRTPHRRDAADREAVEAALARMELGALRHRTATRLSGGEQARVLIARALAQETPLLLADEPTAGLDPAHQLATLARLGGLAAEGRGVLVSLHDLALAVQSCTRVVVLAKGGAVAADGPPEAVLTPALLAAVFGIEALRIETPRGIVLQPVGVIAGTGPGG